MNLGLIFYCLEECIKFGVCLISYMFFKFFLPVKVNFRVKREYILLLFRECCFILYFWLIYTAFQSYGVLAVLYISLSSACVYVFKILSVNSMLPVVLYIRDSVTLDKPILKSSKELTVEYDDRIDSKAMSSIVKDLLPDAIIVNGVSADNLREIIQNRGSAGVFIQSSPVRIRKVILRDLFYSIGSVVGSFSYKFGIVADHDLYADIDEDMSSYGVRCKKVDMKSGKYLDIDVLIVTTLLTDPKKDDYSTIINAASFYSKKDIPSIVLTPMMPLNAWNNRDFMDKYEIILQRNKFVSIVRVPNIIYERQSLRNIKSCTCWQHMSNISQYLLNITDAVLNTHQRLYHYSHFIECDCSQLINMIHYVGGMS